MDNKKIGLVLQLAGVVLIWIYSGSWVALGALAIIRLVVWWGSNMFERRFGNEDTNAKKELRLDNFPVEGKDKVSQINIIEFRKVIREEKPEKIFALARGVDDAGTWAYFYTRKFNGDLVKTHALYPMVEDRGLADSKNNTFYASVNIFSDSPYKYKRVEYPGIHPFSEFGRGRSKFVLVENAD